jgi:hypothetical protein
MKKIFSLAILAMALVFTGCDQNNPDDYSNYPQLIVGKWFNFTPTASVFMNFGADGKYIQQGYDVDLGWIEYHGTYRIDGNVMNKTIENEDGTHKNSAPATIQVTNEKFIVKIEDPNLGDKENYRVKESFDIKGNYSYLNSAVKVESAEGKTALQLPEGVTFQGQNSIPVDAMHGDRIIDVMKKFFADATFAADGKLNHTLDGEAKTKNYTLDGNNLTFNLYEGSETYKVNATSFPDEDGDRLFIIIPKQAAWLGGMVDMIEKEQADLTLNEAQIAELEKEFMATFETFTVILSLSKK